MLFFFEFGLSDGATHKRGGKTLKEPEISKSKHFRRCDDGRYLFRLTPCGRTVVLEEETALKAHKKLVRLIPFAPAFGIFVAWGMIIPLEMVLLGNGYILNTLPKLVLGIVLTAASILLFVAVPFRGIMRNAPVASENLPFPWWDPDFKLDFDRLPQGLFFFLFVSCVVLATIFVGLAGLDALSDDIGDGETWSIIQLVLWGVFFAVFAWVFSKLDDRQKRRGQEQQ